MILLLPYLLIRPNPAGGQTVVYGDPLSAPENFATQINRETLQRYPIFSAREDILRDLAASALLPASDTQTINHLRLRGGNASQSVILADDLMQLSPLSSDNAAAVMRLPRQGLQEMLLLEGPQSARYAPAAANGVLQLTSAPFETFDSASAWHWSYAQQVASHGTWREGLSLGRAAAQEGQIWWQIMGQREDRQGISQAREGRERDGQHASWGQWRFGQKFHQWRWQLAAQTWQRKFDLDGGWPMQDTADYGRSTWQTLTGHAQWQATPAWSHHYAFEILQEKSAFYGTWANQMHGQQKQSAWRSTWQQAAWQVELGHYGRWENYSSLGHKQNEQHLFIWGRYAYHPQGTVSYGLRTIWGHHPTIVQQAAVAREFKLRSLLLRPHAAWGTAFKRPSLYQKFEPRWGNSALQAEKSCQQEFGLAWGQAAWQGDVTFFWGRAERGIIFNWDAEGGRYQNGPKIKQKGLSASWQWKRTSYQVMASVTTFWGKRLPYTPTWQSRITWQQNWGQHWQGHLAYAYQGSRRESDFSKLKPYHYGSAAVIYTRKDWQIEGRIENLWRHKYVQMHGYNVDPQSFILTASYQH